MKSNPFVAMCKFEENNKIMSFENCNLFKRSFTTQGLGYTFNNEREEIMIKKRFRSTELSHNIKRRPSLMKSTSSEYSLTVIIETNAEEVESAEKGIVHKPKEISVSIHNPKEPADTKFIPSTSVKIPLGSTTTFLITPKARKIDESGKELTESERGCRLDEDTDALDIFNVYTRVGCLLECKMQYSIKMCGCTPWNYPINMLRDKVTMKMQSF